MPVRKVTLEKGEYYHLYSRGVDRRSIYEDQRDYNRFIKMLSYYRQIKPPVKFSLWENPVHRPSKEGDQLPKYLISLVAYCLMPNHFHLLVKQEANQGVTLFMHRLLNSHTHHFNLRHGRKGSLFQSRFQAIHVSDNEQLLHLSRYIHLNPRKARLVNRAGDYSFSSMNQFLDNGGIVDAKIVMDQFSSPSDYELFVESYEDTDSQIAKITRITIDDEPKG